MPRVMQFLSGYFKKEIGTHLNGDETFALGAAFLGANVSYSSRVKPIYLFDYPNYDILLKIKKNTTEGD